MGQQELWAEFQSLKNSSPYQEMGTTEMCGIFHKENVEYFPDQATLPWWDLNPCLLWWFLISGSFVSGYPGAEMFLSSSPSREFWICCEFIDSALWLEGLCFISAAPAWQGRNCCWDSPKFLIPEKDLDLSSTPWNSWGKAQQQLQSSLELIFGRSTKKWKSQGLLPLFVSSLCVYLIPNKPQHS